METFRIFTTEENGLTDTKIITTNKSIEDAKSEYIENRRIQSVKGFKRPMPLDVTIQRGY